MRIRRAAADVAAALHTVWTGHDRLADWRWLIWAGVLRLSLPALKRAVSLPRLVRAVRASAGDSTPSAVTRRTELLQHWLDSSSPLLSSNCLERSLVVYGTLQCGCADAALVVGFRRTGADVQGHMWVECGGRLVVEPPAPADAFVETCAFDATGHRLPGESLRRDADARHVEVA